MNFNEAISKWDKANVFDHIKEEIMHALIYRYASTKQRELRGNIVKLIELEMEFSVVGALLIHRVLRLIRKYLKLNKSPDTQVQFLSVYLTIENKHIFCNDMKDFQGLSILSNILKTPHNISKFCIEQTLRLIFDLIHKSSDYKESFDISECLHRVMNLIEIFESNTILFHSIELLSELICHDTVSLIAPYLINFIQSNNVYHKHAATGICLRIWSETNLLQFFTKESLEWTNILYPHLSQLMLIRPISIQFEASVLVTVLIRHDQFAHINTMLLKSVCAYIVLEGTVGGSMVLVSGRQHQHQHQHSLLGEELLASVTSSKRLSESMHSRSSSVAHHSMQRLTALLTRKSSATMKSSREKETMTSFTPMSSSSKIGKDMFDLFVLDNGRDNLDTTSTTAVKTPVAIAVFVVQTVLDILSLSTYQESASESVLLRMRNQHIHFAMLLFILTHIEKNDNNSNNNNKESKVTAGNTGSGIGSCNPMDYNQSLKEKEKEKELQTEEELRVMLETLENWLELDSFAKDEVFHFLCEQGCRTVIVPIEKTKNNNKDDYNDNNNNNSNNNTTRLRDCIQQLFVNLYNAPKTPPSLSPSYSHSHSIDSKPIQKIIPTTDIRVVTRRLRDRVKPGDLLRDLRSAVDEAVRTNVVQIPIESPTVMATGTTKTKTNKTKRNKNKKKYKKEVLEIVYSPVNKGEKEIDGDGDNDNDDNDNDDNGIALREMMEAVMTGTFHRHKRSNHNHINNSSSSNNNNNTTTNNAGNLNTVPGGSQAHEQHAVRRIPLHHHHHASVTRRKPVSVPVPPSSSTSCPRKRLSTTSSSANTAATATLRAAAELEIHYVPSVAAANATTCDVLSRDSPRTPVRPHSRPPTHRRQSHHPHSEQHQSPRSVRTQPGRPMFVVTRNTSPIAPPHRPITPVRNTSRSVTEYPRPNSAFQRTVYPPGGLTAFPQPVVVQQRDDSLASTRVWTGVSPDPPEQFTRYDKPFEAHHGLPSSSPPINAKPTVSFNIREPDSPSSTRVAAGAGVISVDVFTLSALADPNITVF
eukprot:gene9064-18775_t